MIPTLLLWACTTQPAPPGPGADATADDTGAADTGTPDSGLDSGADTADTGDTGDTGTDDTAVTPMDADCDGFTDDVDCDDGDARVFPGAREVCSDGVVNDCGGSVEAATDLCDTSLTMDEALVRWEYPASTDGIRLGPVGDLNGDGYDDVALGWSMMSPTVSGTSHVIYSAGELYLYHGPMQGTFTLGDEDAHVDGVLEGDTIGWDVTGLGDVDGDGYDDFAVGAPDDPYYVSDTPSVYLVHGPVNTPRFTEDMVLLDGSGEADCLGGVIQPVGDADGDGKTDVLVSARCMGQVHLISASADTAQVPGDDDIATFYVPYEETEAYYPYRTSSRFGYSLAAGDLDADGTTDVLIGAPEPYGYLAGSDRGALGFVSIYHGPSAGVRVYDDVDTLIAGSRSDTIQRPGEDLVDLELGVGLTAGDLNEDGYDDVIAGAPMRNEGNQNYQEGGVYVYFGPVDQSAYGIPDADLAILGDEDNDRIGGELDASRDLDGDGHLDLLVGTGRMERNGDEGYYYPSACKKIWIFTGPFSAGSTLAADADVVIDGEGINAMGLQARAAGDTNGDGVSEVLVGDQAGNLALFDLVGLGAL